MNTQLVSLNHLYKNSQQGKQRYHCKDCGECHVSFTLSEAIQHKLKNDVERLISMALAFGH